MSHPVVVAHLSLDRPHAYPHQRSDDLAWLSNVPTHPPTNSYVCNPTTYHWYPQGSSLSYPTHEALRHPNAGNNGSSQVAWRYHHTQLYVMWRVQSHCWLASIAECRERQSAHLAWQ